MKKITENKLKAGKSSLIKPLLFLMIVFQGHTFSGCKVYSFTGASLSPDIKTANVKFFTSTASLAPPTLTQTLTEALKDKLNSQTSLALVRSGGDLIYEGQITAYAVTSIAIQGNETAASNRLTIGISVKFTNTKDEQYSTDKTYSRFADFPASKSLTSVEVSLIDEIKQQLIQDIFNASIANW
jgi:hypothetical protein